MRKIIAVLVVTALSGCQASDGAPDPVPTTGSGVATVTPSSSSSANITPETVSSAESAVPDCRPDLFAHPPVDLDAVEYLVPFGLMIDSHVTPVDHQYFQNFVEPERQIEVYSPGDGRVVSMQHFGAPVAENASGIVDDYRLVIEHTCAVSSVYIHIDRLVPELAAVAPPVGEYTSVDVAVETGQTIGWFTSNVDYNIVDLDFTTDGLVEPASYEREPWKTHVPDTFEYFTPELATAMESLSLRTEPPRGGVFTHDVDGRLVGNWFEQGTDGYGGVDRERYWAGHLAFAYDHIDPSLIVVSVGTFVDRSRQFAVAGNGPDPADVSVVSGPVVYELVGWDYMVGDERWDRTTFAEGITAVPTSESHGSLLVQLVDDRTLMLEVFPDLPAASVDGFTDSARRYTR